MYTNYMTDFWGYRLKKLRLSQKLSQIELGERSGISQEYIGKIERRDVTNVGTEVVSALATTLKVHPALLLFGKVTEPTLELDHEEKALYPLKKSEKELLATYRNLPLRQKKALTSVAKALLKD